jgi:hypothetical protein
MKTYLKYAIIFSVGLAIGILFPKHLFFKGPRMHQQMAKFEQRGNFKHQQGFKRDFKNFRELSETEIKSIDSLKSIAKQSDNWEDKKEIRKQIFEIIKGS